MVKLLNLSLRKEHKARLPLTIVIHVHKNIHRLQARPKIGYILHAGMPVKGSS